MNALLSLFFAVSLLALFANVAGSAPVAPADSAPAVAAPGAPADADVAVAESQYVRLRGSSEIHLRACEKVKRADPEGIVPAKKDDGPPCYLCRRSECR